MSLITFLAHALRGDRPATRTLLRELRASGWTLEQLYLDLLALVMVEVGDRWAKDELSVADEHLVSTVVEAMLAETAAELPPPAADAPLVLVAGAAGEHHRIGLTMLTTLLASEGWRVLGLGADVPADAMASFAQRERPALIMLSVTMTHHLSAVRAAIAALRAAGVDAPVMVGGAAIGLSGLGPEVLGAQAVGHDGREALAYARRVIRLHVA